MLSCLCFFFNDPAPTAIYTLSLHDALPICGPAGRQRGTRRRPARRGGRFGGPEGAAAGGAGHRARGAVPDRKSTRLNSSHLGISYAVFCLKKKTKIYIVQLTMQHTTRYKPT